MNRARRQTLLHELREQLAERLDQNPLDEASNYTDQVHRLVSDHLLLSGESLETRQYFIERLLSAIRGFDILEPYMKDPSITEIMVNGASQIYVEQAGHMRLLDLAFDDQQHLTDFVTGLFSRENRELSLAHPIADLRLPDGSRANAVLPPIAAQGPVLTIRKFTGIRPSPQDLLETGCLTAQALDFLAEAVRSKKSIFICGGTGAGKTTLLNALSNFIPSEERIITVEDSAELQLCHQPNLVSLEARQVTGSGAGEVSLSDLIRSALRMRPDRILVGEVRGDEAYMLVHAANTGHPGSLCTGHGNSCKDMLLRLANMISGCTRLPYAAILHNLASTLDYLVHLVRLPDGRRRIVEIVEVGPVIDQRISTRTHFVYEKGGDQLVRQSQQTTATP